MKTVDEIFLETAGMYGIDLIGHIVDPENYEPILKEEDNGWDVENWLKKI